MKHIFAADNKLQGHSHVQSGIHQIEDLVALKNLDETIEEQQLEDQLLAENASCCIHYFQHLIEEIRSSQIFIDKQGLPIRRRNPKIAIRKIEPKNSIA